MADPLLDKLAAAKLWLISDAAQTAGGQAPGSPGLAYLATALYALVPVTSSEVETASVDDHWRIYLDPGWLTQAPVREVAAELAHLTWHLLLEHAERARDQHVDSATAESWHTAADLTVHDTLGHALVPALPSPHDHGLAPGRSAEEYFAQLSRLPPATGEPTGAQGEDHHLPGCGSGCDGLRRSHDLPPDLEAAVEPEEARHIRRRVAIAYREHCTGIGTIPGEAGRWAQQILEPSIAWEPLLAQAVRRAAGWAHGHAEYTYRRPSRRSGAVPGVVLPATRRPLPRVAMVVDTSGSVDDTLLGRAQGEVDGALRALGVSGEAVSVIACDSAAGQAQPVRRGRDVRLVGGGGTDMRVGIEAAARLRPRADLVVVLTDGYTPWPQSSTSRQRRGRRPSRPRARPPSADPAVGDPRRVPPGVMTAARPETLEACVRRRTGSRPPRPGPTARPPRCPAASTWRSSAVASPASPPRCTWPSRACGSRCWRPTGSRAGRRDATAAWPRPG